LAETKRRGGRQKNSGRVEKEIRLTTAGQFLPQPVDLEVHICYVL
jgi:hypothetical protein